MVLSCHNSSHICFGCLSSFDFNCMTLHLLNSHWRDAQNLAHSINILKAVGLVKRDLQSMPLASEGGSTDINSFVVEEGSAKDDIIRNRIIVNDAELDCFDAPGETEFRHDQVMKADKLGWASIVDSSGEAFGGLKHFNMRWDASFVDHVVRTTWIH